MKPHNAYKLGAWIGIFFYCAVVVSIFIFYIKAEAQIVEKTWLYSTCNYDDCVSVYFDGDIIEYPISKEVYDISPDLTDFKYDNARIIIKEEPIYVASTTDFIL